MKNIEFDFLSLFLYPRIQLLSDVSDTYLKNSSDSSTLPLTCEPHGRSVSSLAAEKSGDAGLLDPSK